MSLERLIVSGAVNLGGWLVWLTVIVDISVQYSGHEALHRMGLSVAAEICYRNI